MAAVTQWVRSNPTVVNCTSDEIGQRINDNITQFQAGKLIDTSYCVNNQWFRLILNPRGHRWDCRFSPTGTSFTNPSDKLRLIAQSEGPVIQKIKTVFEKHQLQLPTTIFNTSDSYFSGQQIALVQDNCHNCQ